MVKLSNLVPAISQILNVPQKTVNVIAMHLRREGLISSGGRGRGGAEMSARDTATLLIGVMGADQLKDAPAIVRDLGSYELEESTDEEEGELVEFEPSNFYGIEVGDTLLESLTKLIEYFIANKDLTEGQKAHWNLLFVVTLIPRRDFSSIKFYFKDSPNIKATYYSPVLGGNTEHSYTIHDLKMTKHYGLIKYLEVTDSSIRDIARILTNRPPAKWLESDDNEQIQQ